MELTPLSEELLDQIGDFKGRIVDYALSDDVARHLRSYFADFQARSEGGTPDPMSVVDNFIFEYEFSNGLTLLDRFLSRNRLDEAEQYLMSGMRQNVSSTFEALDDPQDLPDGLMYETVRFRCCYSDLEYQIVPTIPGGLRALTKGMFATGRIYPIAGTDFWTTSGTTHILPASAKPQLSDLVSQSIMANPQLSYRNPEYLRRAEEVTSEAHDRFVTTHRGNVIFGTGAEIARAYADAVAGLGDPTQNAQLRENTRTQMFDDLLNSNFGNETDVALFSHRTAGLNFCVSGGAFAAALESGANAGPEAVELIVDYLEDESLPRPFIEQLIEERLPASEKALALATDNPAFSWDADGPQFLSGLPSMAGSRPSTVILPTICHPEP